MDSIKSGVKYECLLFDMDDTLYPLSSGLNLACRKNIQDYMLHNLKIEESEVPRMCVELYKEHGTTMAGLKTLGYKFDDDEFHAYAHGRLPYESLKPDPMLKNLLHSMPQRKLIFTNADRAHAVKVLSRLGLEDCFEGIICFETLNPSTEQNNKDYGENGSQSENPNGFSSGSESENEHEVRILCKPSVEAMKAAIKIANVNPKKTLFFDDSARNIAAGKAAGLNTIIVGSSVPVPGADMALESIHNIKEAIPFIPKSHGIRAYDLQTLIDRHHIFIFIVHRRSGFLLHRRSGFFHHRRSDLLHRRSDFFHHRRSNSYSEKPTPISLLPSPIRLPCCRIRTPDTAKS